MIANLIPVAITFTSVDGVEVKIAPSPGCLVIEGRPESLGHGDSIRDRDAMRIFDPPDQEITDGLAKNIVQTGASTVIVTPDILYALDPHFHADALEVAVAPAFVTARSITNWRVPCFISRIRDIERDNDDEAQL